MDITILQNLIGVAPRVWDIYGMRHEPLRNKIPPEQLPQLLQLARNTAETLVEKVKTEFAGKTPEEVLQELNVTICRQPQMDGGGYDVFACYEEPNTVTLYTKPVEKADAMLAEIPGGAELIQTDLSQILFAHELFHYYEYSEKDGLPTAQKQLTMWKIGRWERKCQVRALGEIAAMHFAAGMLQLNYSPYMLDVLLLYPSNRPKAEELYTYIMQLAEKDGNGGCG